MNLIIFSTTSFTVNTNLLFQIFYKMIIIIISYPLRVMTKKDEDILSTSHKIQKLYALIFRLIFFVCSPSQPLSIVVVVILLIMFLKSKVSK